MDDSYHASDFDKYTLHSLDGNPKVKHELSLGNNNNFCGAGMVSDNSPSPTVGDSHHSLKRKANEDFDDDLDDDLIGMGGGVESNGTDLHSPINVDQTPRKSLPPNGKKTKGRVKIKMEFIDNKLRRYTTFSKRKTGIMKKAYELSTLTGTQVMLLVASETGHVYTFATRKLQPMITSEAGKALIQTCLNSPDPPVGPGGSGPDQRMSATGFEEVDLTYTVAEDTENKDGLTKCHTYYLGGSVSSPSESGQSSGARSPTPPPSSLSKGQNNHVISPTTSVVSLPSPVPLVTPLHFTTTASIPTSNSGNGGGGGGGSTKNGNPNLAPKGISVQLPQSGGFATILTSGTGLTPATALQLSRQSMTSTVVSTSGGNSVYRFSPSSLQVSLPGVGSQGSATSTGNSAINGGSHNVTVVPATGSSQNLSVLSVMPTNTSSGVLPGGLQMYQTAQGGLVYATQQSTATALPEGVILNLGQEHSGSGGQQFITFPVSLAHTQKPVVSASGTSSSSGSHKKSRHHK